MGSVTILLPIAGYMALTMLLALWARRRMLQSSNPNFIEEYFIGGRSMGGFVLAMTIIATYTSASSFIGGPGMAYSLGLGWVLLAMIQVPTTFLTLGVLGKRFAIIGRKIRAVTIVDFLYARYKSEAVVIICSVAILVFFASSMLAQFIGGARVFQAVTGHSYGTGLAIFGICVVLYTTVGGFRAVALTDAVQGIVMVFAAVVVLLAVLKAGGGVENCINTLKADDIGLISPNGPGGKIPTPFLFSFWILVGLGILGLPQTAQRCFAYKDSRAMHNAMIMGTLIIGFLLLCTHLAGALGRAVLPGLETGDLIVPSLTVRLLSPFWAGVFVAGPLAAIMSTVDSMLLTISASIVKDLYLRYRLKGDAALLPVKSMERMTFGCTLAVGVVVFLAAFRPPDLLVWINLFAFGGLEAVFLWPIVLGLYWKKANATGAVVSMLAGVGVFMLLSVTRLPLEFLTGLSSLPFRHIHPVVPSLAAGALFFALGNRMGKPASDEIVRLFWEDNA